tara:strand:+ start:19084 stop:19791 length:708 start_codon:yes stop_codon:yes gene_type:complete
VRIFKLYLILFFLYLLIGCQIQNTNSPIGQQKFRISDMAKGDIDLVAEVSVKQANSYLKELTEKLYRQNPTYVKGVGSFEQNIKDSISKIFSKRKFQEFQEKRAADLIMLALSDDYLGDRVAAFIRGIKDMQTDAYGGEKEFFLFHKFDPQKIYYLARNIEIASWRIRNKKQKSGQPYLVSITVNEEGEPNISSERLFGKLISLHDHFAHLIAGTTNRRIKNVVQGLASAIFFPI